MKIATISTLRIKSKKQCTNVVKVDEKKNERLLGFVKTERKATQAEFHKNQFF